MHKKTVKEIIENTLPELEMVESVPRADAVRPQGGRPGASLSELRKKYLGGDAAADGPALSLDIAGISSVADGDEVEVKQVRNRRSPADPADDPGPRAMIVSRTEGIVGSQG